MNKSYSKQGWVARAPRAAWFGQSWSRSHIIFSSGAGVL